MSGRGDLGQSVLWLAASSVEAFSAEALRLGGASGDETRRRPNTDCFDSNTVMRRIRNFNNQQSRAL